MFWHRLASPRDTVLRALDVAVDFSVTQVSRLDPQPCSGDPPAPPFPEAERCALSRALSDHSGVTRIQVLQHVFALTFRCINRMLYLGPESPERTGPSEKYQLQGQDAIHLSPYTHIN